MMHTGVINSEVGRLSQLLVICPEKLFEPHLHLLDCRHVIPLANRQPEIACPVEYDVGDVDCLYLCVRCPYDVS